MNEYAGQCPDCEAVYHGEGFSSPRNRLCVKCGSPLRVTKDGVLICSGSSPFTAEEYIIGIERSNRVYLGNDIVVFYLTLNWLVGIDHLKR